MSARLGFLADAARFADLDRAALHNALLALRVCPNCRGDLLPVAYASEVYGCATCRETWYLPAVVKP